MSSKLAASNDSGPTSPEVGQARLIEVEQVSRYLWAAQVAADRVVLDAGCGTGYGSRLLADGGARQVIGVDIARASLETATPEIPETVRLVAGDLRKLEFQDDAFDLVVCFEVIEYVDEPLTVLGELTRVLAPRGLLLVSIPNCAADQPGRPYRGQEFSSAELEQALAATLSHVQFVTQHDHIASVLGTSGTQERQEGDADLALQKLRPATPGEETYTVAMASGAELPATRALAVAGGSAPLHEWFSAWEARTNQMAETNDQLEDLQTRLEERDRLAKLLGEAEARCAQLPELELRIADLELELEYARHAAADARQEADQLDRMLMYGRRTLRLVRPLIQPLRRLRRKLRG
jgi:ubiquinone/menaquinone biosynthesis C-methylase UbiE